MGIQRRKRTKIRAVRLGEGLPNLATLRFELQDYVDILLGRKDHSLPDNIMALAELANAYLARAREIEALIYQLEREGQVIRGSQHYKFRTGELRSLIDLFSKSYELGSRRITVAAMEFRERN